jgi:hypothetical protein
MLIALMWHTRESLCTQVMTLLIRLSIDGGNHPCGRLRFCHFGFL